MHKPDLQDLQVKYGITFKNQKLLKQAFTHSSFANENRFFSKDNERLEFLGDSVLSLIVSEYLFQTYPEFSEGELTKMRASLVCEPTLVKIVNHLQFNTYIFLGRGEESTGGRNKPSILADVFESFIGALFLDQGIVVVKSFIHHYVIPIIESNPLHLASDYKSLLQEFVQNNRLGILHYQFEVELESSPHRNFLAKVFINEQLHGQGIGKSKKEAAQQAANQAWNAFNKVQL